jgi:hypothetical protein
MTTTPPPSSLPLPSTPFKTHSGTTDTYDPKYEDRTITLQRLSFDMASYFVGPVPPDVFLDKFLAPAPPIPNDGAFRAGMFSRLKALPTEAKMYQNLVTNFIPDC